MKRLALFAAALTLTGLASALPASAEDTVKLTIGQRGEIGGRSAGVGQLPVHEPLVPRDQAGERGTGSTILGGFARNGIGRLRRRLETWKSKPKARRQPRNPKK